MSIIPGRGDKKQPPMPTPTPANIVRGPGPQPPAMADPRALHPAVQQHAIAWSEMLEETDKLRSELSQARHELALAHDSIEQRESAIEFERQRLVQADRLKEKYQRFAMEINTKLGDGVAQIRAGLALVEQAQARAMEVAQEYEPAIAQVEDAIKEAVAAAREEPPHVAMAKAQDDEREGIPPPRDARG